MKSLITLNLEGELIQYIPNVMERESTIGLVVVINDKRFPVETVRSILTFEDPCPDRYICQIDLQIHDKTRKGWLTNKSDERILDSTSFQFERKLNHRYNYTLNQRLVPYLTKITVEYLNSGFIIPEANPILGESSLEAIEMVAKSGPCNLSMYFQDYNYCLIQDAQANNKDVVALLKIKAITEKTLDRFWVSTVYYQTVYEKTKKFPVILQPETTAKKEDKLIDV